MIIYIHGFNSSGNGDKSNQLRQLFPNIEIYSPSYDSSDFNTIEEMISQIENKIKDKAKVLFIGCSLGGYLAQFLAKHFHTKSILLNPCYDPQFFLAKKLGENILHATNERYELTLENIHLLKKYELTSEEINEISSFVFSNQDDDVIPYEGVVKYYHTKSVTLFEKGGHRFTNLQDIQEDILRIY